MKRTDWLLCLARNCDWFKFKILKFKKTRLERCRHLCVCPLIDHRREPIISCISPHMHVFTANQMTRLPTDTLSIDQSNRPPGFLHFQLTETMTWLWRSLLQWLSKRQSPTIVFFGTPIVQMIIFNQSNSYTNHFLPQQRSNLLSHICRRG